jgi:outer membrane protein insertion porin family
MLPGKPTISLLLITAFLIGMNSCTVVKKYPRSQPFVYKTNINVIGNFTNEQRSDLESRLRGQLDDSMRPRTVDKVIVKVMKNPPAYKNENADRSKVYMRALLRSLGYFNDTSTYHADTLVTDEDQFRTTVTFDVRPGKLVTLDSISYNLQKPELQQITVANQKESLLKKGDPFAKATVGGELDRLVELYRDSGYLRFSRDEMIGLWDTLAIDLLRPSLDPFEQLAQLQELARRREKPTANLEIRLRPNYDSSKLVKYYIGNVWIYPDFNPDTLGLIRKVTEVDTNTYVIQYRNKFKPKIFPTNIYLRHGETYRQRRYQRTINRLNALGTWRVINLQPLPRPGQDTVDFTITLTPSDKYVFSTNIEVSQNQSALAGNLLGFGVNTGIQNRNFARAANQSNTNLRYTVELGNNFVQTQQVIFSQNIYFPRPVPTFKRWIPERLRDNVRTVLSFNAANTERFKLYNLTTVNGAWGYEYSRNFTRKNATLLLSVKLPNIEYSYLKERDSLKTLIALNPSLRNIFTDGLISSVSMGATLGTSHNKTQNIFSLNVEESGLLVGMIPSRFLDTQLYRYIKVSGEMTKLIKHNKSAIAIRAFAGVGYEFNFTTNPNKKNNLPFFKEYFAGGPNSMRGWRLRKLGPGSALKDFADYPERFGDVQLELNAEFRFQIANISGVRLESVLFSDIGNIWFLKKAAGSAEEVFNIGRLGKDIAIDMGTGLRIDFSFFLIRLDYAYKVKDPSPDINNAASQNKLFYDWKLFNGQFQLGINYPFKL